MAQDLDLASDSLSKALVILAVWARLHPDGNLPYRERDGTLDFDPEATALIAADLITSLSKLLSPEHATSIHTSLSSKSGGGTLAHGALAEAMSTRVIGVETVGTSHDCFYSTDLRDRVCLQGPSQGPGGPIHAGGQKTGRGTDNAGDGAGSGGLGTTKPHQGPNQERPE